MRMTWFKRQVGKNRYFIIFCAALIYIGYAESWGLAIALFAIEMSYALDEQDYANK